MFVASYIDNCLLCDNFFDRGIERSNSLPLVCTRCIKTRLSMKARKFAKRARKSGTVGKVRPGELYEVVVKSGLRCSNCSVVCSAYPDDPLQLTIDHKYPMSHGGPNIKENLVVLCRTCHHEKNVATNSPPEHGTFFDVDFDELDLFSSNEFTF